MSEYYKQSANVKVYQEGECDENDAKARRVPFRGLLLSDIQSDSEDLDEE